MSGARPYPPGFFDEWTGEQRNVFYAEEARRYRVTQTGNGGRRMRRPFLKRNPSLNRTGRCR